MKVFATLCFAGAATALKLHQTTFSVEKDMVCDFLGEGYSLSWDCFDHGSCYVYDIEEGGETSSGERCDNTCANNGLDKDGNECEQFVPGDDAIEKATSFKCEFFGEGYDLSWSCYDPHTSKYLTGCYVYDVEEGGQKTRDGEKCDNTCAANGLDKDGYYC